MEVKHKKLLLFAVLYCAALLALFAVVNLDAINAFLTYVLGIFRPVLIGLVAAYLCNPVFSFFERKTFYRIKISGLRRGLSLFFTYLCVFLLIAGIVMILIPPIIHTLLDFLEDYDANLAGTVWRINDIFAWINNRIPFGEGSLLPALDPGEVSEAVSGFFAALNIDTDTIIEKLTLENISGIFGFVTGTVGLITDTIIGFFISLYLLSSKEKRYAQIMRFRIAMFGDRTNDRITRFVTVADDSFGKFVRRRCIDAAIIGLAVYLVAVLMGVSNPQFLAAIVGLSDIVPILGPAIGIISVVLLLLITQPSYILPLLLAIILIHILNRRLLSKKLFGDRNGVSTLCVIIAVVIMGGIWGPAGFLLGVPIFATVLELCDYYFERRLEAKGLPTDARNYGSAASFGKEESFFRRSFDKPRRQTGDTNADTATGLSDLEHIQLDTYALARKHHIFSETSEEALARFGEEAALLTASGQGQTDAVPAPSEAPFSDINATN